MSVHGQTYWLRVRSPQPSDQLEPGVLWVDTSADPPTVWVRDVDGWTAVSGAPGPPGPAGGTYEHDQAVPSAVWTIDHALGFHPNVTIVDTLDRTVWGDVRYPSVNQVVVEFSAAFSGTAYLS